MPTKSSYLLLVLSPGVEFTDDTRNVFPQLHEVSKVWMSFKYTTLGKQNRTGMKHLGEFQIGIKRFTFVTGEKSV